MEYKISKGISHFFDLKEKYKGIFNYVVLKDGIMTLYVRKWSVYPGPRYISEGKNSGELFVKRTLKSLMGFCETCSIELVVDLDYTNGYSTSWLEEVFHFNDLRIISTEEPELIEEIEGYRNDYKRHGRFS